MKIKFYIVEEYWYSETFRYIFADKDAAFVAQLLLEPDTAVQEIELEEPSEIKRFKEGVRFACKELKDVYDRTEYNGKTVDIPVLSINYYNKYFNWR